LPAMMRTLSPRRTCMELAMGEALLYSTSGASDTIFM
jgi:hypothetical protein